MSIPMEHLPLALEALKRDSHNGHFGERSRTRSAVLPGRILDILDRTLAEAGAPQHRHDMSVEELRKFYGVKK